LSFALAAALAGCLLGPHDLVIASVPHLGTELAGLLVSRLAGGRVLLELRDIMPDALAFVGVDPRSLLARVLAAYFRAIYRLSDLFAVVGPNMAATLEQRGVPAERIMLLPHAADPRMVAQDGEEEGQRRLSLSGAFVVMYAGSFSSYYNIPNIVDAAAILQDRCPQVRFVLLGAGPDLAMVRERVSHLGLNNVVLPGTVEPQQVMPYLMCADLFVAPLAARQVPPCYRDHISTKICEFMIVGRPILSVGNREILGEFLERHAIGLGVPAGQPAALADAIESFARRPDKAIECGRNARQFAIQNLSCDKVMIRFDRQLRSRLSLLRQTGR